MADRPEDELEPKPADDDSVNDSVNDSVDHSADDSADETDAEKKPEQEQVLIGHDGMPITKGEADASDQSEFSAFLDESMLGRFLKAYWDRALLAIALVLLGFTLFNRWQDSNVAAESATRQRLTQLMDTVDRAREWRATRSGRFAPATVDGDKQALLQDFFAITDAVDPDTDAQAALMQRLRGDFFWYLATFANGDPEGPDLTAQDADTAPIGIELKTADGYLADAEQAYQAVVEGYPEEANSVIVALFGLAAVAEEQGDFDAAAGAYEKLLARDDLTEAQRDLARGQSTLLEQYRLPSRIGTPKTPEPSSASDVPSVLAPEGDATTQPSSQPSTQPGQPAATQPASEGSAPDNTDPTTQPDA